MSVDAGGSRRSYRSPNNHQHSNNVNQHPGSFHLTSETIALSSQPSPRLSRQMRSSLKKSVPSVEEGDFVWVSDESGFCTSAVVVRTGFVFDEDTEQEQHVTVVHTEDGEERAIRDRSLVKLPSCHHPKELLPLELHDLSNVPLMATNGDTGRTETFTSEQLENVALYTLRARYRMEQVYTWVDRVLIGLNPVTPLPIYTPDHMQAYNKSREHTPLYEKDTVHDAPPHVFALAQNALRSMQDSNEDQAVILLGGMGAGKSEAAKLLVQYLCEIGDSATLRQENDADAGVLHPIGQQILHAFTILEAFGNAATLQNPNSSRFAKMISVEFSKHGDVIGGGFTTHYFEKSRIIECRNHERNFHVLYQVLAGVQHDPALRDALELNKSISEFALLKQANPDLTHAALDARDYRDLMSSFSALRIRKNERIEIVRIVAALLHLGNVEFVLDPEGGKSTNTTTSMTISDANSCALKDPAQILLAAKLLDVEPVVLDNYFRTRQFFSKDGGKTVSSLKVVTVHQARKARDTFIRSLYESLFNFLVDTLNGILGGIFDRYEKSNIVINSQGVHVLDMVGFENLEASLNTFDQLCFNYWSEKVHHFYVQNTLAINYSELEEETQQVQHRLSFHATIDITSEQEKCLQLFEDKSDGIFTLLSGSAKARAPNDDDFVHKLFSSNENVTALSRPNVGAETTSDYLAPSKDWRLLFIIQHHCGKITYNGKGLAAKNALTISSTCAAIMQSSKNAVLHAVGAAQMAAASSEKAKVSTLRESMSKFRTSITSAKEGKVIGESCVLDVYNQADALLHALNHTGKNFFVCIKPNEELEEGVFDSAYVMKQIRENHVVELMQASRSIFTVQLTYGHFFRRYKNVCGHRGTLESLLRSLSAIGVLEEETFVVGKAKVYLTSYQWKKLEQARFLYLNACATMIQRNMLRGGFRKKSARLLYVMRGLREAMTQRDSNDLIQHIANCAQILGKRACADIRVLNEGRQLIVRLDEEEYVNSIIADATRIGHPNLIEYAVRVAEKSSPWLAVDPLRRKSKSIVALQKQKNEKLAAVNGKLRAYIIANDPEALMGSLATLEEPSVESLERKLATMMIIRALEEKSAVESVSYALSTITEVDDDASVLNALLGPATKAVRLGVEAKVAKVAETLRRLNSRIHESDEEIEIEEEIEEDVSTRSKPIETVDLQNIFAALQKALDDENYVAVDKVLARLKVLGISDGDPRLDTAKRAIAAQTIPASMLSERKQVIKFLAVAKISQDIELLSEAIKEAVGVGLAKWDFNLKNAEREREKLLAAQSNSPTTVEIMPVTTQIVVKSVKKVKKVKKVVETTPIEMLLQIWEAEDVNVLDRLHSAIPPNLQGVFDAKVFRLQQVASIQKTLTEALECDVPKTVEQALGESISMGFCSPRFEVLFEYHATLRSRANGEEKKEDVATMDGLHAAIQLLTRRVEENAEIRQDAIELLATEMDEFSNPSGDSDSVYNAEEREQILLKVGNLRRHLESRIAAAARLESTLALPTDAASVKAIELSIEVAREAGVHERLLLKAEDKLTIARRKSVGTGERQHGLSYHNDTESSFSLNGPNDSKSPRCDAMGDRSTDTSSDKHHNHGIEKDAVAFHHFEHLRGFNSQSTGVLAKKLCWESRAISQSLSILYDTMDETINTTFASAGQMALSINRCILGYMRDRIVFYREMLAQYILQIGLMKPSLVDEIYLQLMKQLTKNPKRDSSIRGWSLFAMCATSFPPSLALQKYVILFLKAQTADSNSFWRLVRNFAAYALKKLENLLENGATGFIPSIDEIRGYEARPPFLATIQLLDGTPLADAFPVTPELTVTQMVEICAHFLGLEDHVVNFLGLTTTSERVVVGKTGATSSSTSISASREGENEPTNDSNVANKEVSIPQTLSVSTSVASPTSYFHKFMTAPSFLSSNMFLGDIFEKELIRGRDVRFVLKIRLNPVYMLQYTDEMYDRLVYIQVQEEIVKGNLPVLEKEALLRLTALAIGVDCGDAPPLSVEEVTEMHVLEYLPPEWQGAHDEEEWAELILDNLTDNLLDDQDALYPVSELQRIYIEEVTRHRLYGSSFFPSKLVNRGHGLNHCLGIEVPNYFVIAVNGYGLHILGRDGSILGFCEYNQIVYSGGSYPQYKVCLKKSTDVSAPVEEIIVTTKYSEELDALITDYKEITALLNEA
ncbi:unconventional myosin-viia [Plasmopara halstedii]|uniref:Unconventional myosin-viia n=1 Tax=Plasmopara halstedii TaxID=4781 RepID=A0A0P1B6L9_PLAHL|nr:unconventional myosin-viia [Plasmopara halstedii]CEG49412.1 unconventional myosin-viia [Plasmopara halstedii]|eukprot:XP_024585781.1 unconventional myosin-viia [Plasmopara halstedii]